MGPLDGARIVEIAGIGPGPFAAMLLGDLGAEVIRVARPGDGLFGSGNPHDLLNRAKRCICVDLKTPEGVEIVLRLLQQTDAVIEGFRPGVMEKLGLGPDVCLEHNPRLVFGRMTGWGQEGPMAQRAGHDINYISLAGALHPLGRAGEKPAIPLNLIGDFGGGGLMLALGIVAALFEARSSGQGQVVDAAMVDGAALLMASIYGAQQTGFWSEQRGTNLLDSGAHFYEVYETSDGEYVSIGAIEKQFYQELLERIGLSGEELPEQMDASQWPAMKRRLTAIFKTRTRDEWCEIFQGSDACFAPVLKMSEAHEHPHNRLRSTFVDANGALQPRPAPRFSRTPTEVGSGPAKLGEHSDEILREVRYSDDEIALLRAKQAVS
jgi:alpha-methylacyl-CoA racemase